MNITNNNIDSGKAFDWGKTSADYARFRDIYPQEFYDKIINRQLCISGQSVLDVGTGTGVLPRNMYRFGAKWTGTDISENQIGQAKILSKGMNIDYYAFSTETIDEALVLKYNPQWSGAGETIRPIDIPDCYKEKFELVYHEEYPLKVHFTRESWNGRMKAC